LVSVCRLTEQAPIVSALKQLIEDVEDEES